MNRKWIIGGVLALFIVLLIVPVLNGLGLVRIRIRTEHRLHHDPQEICFAIRANLSDDVILGIIESKPHLLNVSASDGSTPLHDAVFAKRNTVMVRLLERGAQVDVQKPDHAGGFTPLHLAILGDDPDAVALLLAHGANAELPTEVGETPLELADRLRRWRIVGMLREHTEN